MRGRGRDVKEHDLSEARHAAELVAFAADATSPLGDAESTFFSCVPWKTLWVPFFHLRLY